MRLPSLLTAVVLLAAACSQDPAPAAPDAAAPVGQAASEPLMPADAPPQEETIAPIESASTSCTLDQGPDAAKRLVDRCIAVSPATRPPCHADNPCQMIQDEIDRACEMFGPGEDQPAECAA